MTGHRLRPLLRPRPHPRRRHPLAAPLCTALTLAVMLAGMVSCGVPPEDVAHVIAEEDLPFGLAASERAADTDTLLDNPTGVQSGGTETVNLYFPSENGFTQVQRELPFPVTPNDVVAAIANEPDDAQSNYRSAIGPDDVRNLTIRGGVAEIELDKSFLDLPNAEQRLAVAQLVLSLTAQPGVGQINFVIDGEPLPVPRADGTLAKGEVSRDDFTEMLKKVPTAP